MGRRKLEPQIWRAFGGKTACAVVAKELITIDTEDVSKVNMYRWLMQRNGLFTIQNDKRICFSKLIMGAEGQYFHIDKDVNNYCKQNLTKDPHLKRALQSKSRGKSSIYKGVSLSKRNNTWFAELSVNKIRYRLGYFTSEIKAAMAYDKKMIEIQGINAYTNEKMVKAGAIKPPGDNKKYWNRLSVK